jgi:pyrroline-5-carboxylate reductase
MKLCIIGLGKMGSALLQGMLEAGVFQAKDITGCDLRVAEEESSQDFSGIRTTKNNCMGAEDADIILLAVKPQVINGVLEEIKESVQNKLIISIAAGININRIESYLPSSCRIVRVMPNTPILVKEGISAIAPNTGVTEEDLQIVRDIFGGVGKIVEVEEKLMDAVTGLSGSGPAYIYIIIEALADGGVLMGLPRELSLKLAAQTVLGSARMVLETGKHPGELKDMVTSPAGTTIQGLKVLEDNALRGIILNAVKEAAERSRELNEID